MICAASGGMGVSASARPRVASRSPSCATTTHQRARGHERAAVEHEADQQAEGEDVGGGRDGVAAQLLGRAPAGRVEQDAPAGTARPVSNDGGGVGAVRDHAGDGFGDAEVGELGTSATRPSSKQDVRRLDVAVHDAEARALRRARRQSARAPRARATSAARPLYECVGAACRRRPTRQIWNGSAGSRSRKPKS